MSYFQLIRIGFLTPSIQIGIIIFLFALNAHLRLLSKTKYFQKHNISIYVMYLFAPVYEEIIFRGLIFAFFIHNFSFTFSLIISSLFFGLWHLKNIFLLDRIELIKQILYSTFFFGPLMAVVAYQTQTIWLGIGIHFINNISAAYMQKHAIKFTRRFDEIGHKWLVAIFSLCFCIFLWQPPLVRAADFAVDRDVTYTLNEDLVVGVKEDISIENLTTENFPHSYTLLLTGEKITNIFAQDELNHPLKWQSTESQSLNQPIIKLIVYFPTQQDPDHPPLALGKGQTTRFQVFYDLHQAVVDQGQIRELKLPKMAPNPSARQTHIQLLVKNSLGRLAYLIPPPDSRENLPEWQKFTFSPDELQTGGLRAVFGDFQLYDFQLSYTLNGESQHSSQQTITLPPDTSYQRIAISKIAPLPDQVTVDPDGNWLASYQLTAGQTSEIQVSGSAMVFAQPWRIAALPQREPWLTSQKYWEVNQPKISELAISLSNPESIYGYVTTHLQYDYQRLTNETNRLGALQALNQPQEAICMEFTDLFIALSRAAGIPARQAIGYAHSDSPELQPLSLVADVLHAWPEYWDDHLQVWKPVDPTWEVTTGGSDYFHHWDYNHLTMALNGLDSSGPLPAGYYKPASHPQKDVVVTLGQQFPEDPPELNLRLKADYPWWPFSWWSGRVTIKNLGPTSASNLQANFSLDNTLTLMSLSDSYLPLIPPYGSYDYQFRFRPSLLAFNRQAIKLKLAGQQFTLPLPLKVYLWQLVVSLAIGGLCVIITLTSIKIAQKLRRVPVQK